MNRLQKRKIRKQVRFSCYKKIHKKSGNWEYIKVNSMRFKCKSNNYQGSLPLESRSFKWEYQGEWDINKYNNLEDEIEAVAPPTIEIPDVVEQKPKTRRTRKKKVDE